MSEWRRGFTVGKEAGRSGDSRQYDRRRDQKKYAGSGWSMNDTGQPHVADRSCFAFQRGGCHKGRDCQFSHEQSSDKSIRFNHENRKVQSDNNLSGATSCRDSQCQEVDKHIEAMMCPATLVRSRDKLFRGIAPAYRDHLLLDTVASFSVTRSDMANRMTDRILQVTENMASQGSIIFDGMACVGGNTISFAQKFEKVLSNEYDESRYEMLLHNVRKILKYQNVSYLSGSIIDLAFNSHYNILFLDPEWGGPDYKHKKFLRLTISDVAIEDLCMRVLNECKDVHTIALKLPVNYDNIFFQQTAEREGYSHSLFTDFHNMTLTILQKQC